MDEILKRKSDWLSLQDFNHDVAGVSNTIHTTGRLK